MEHWAIWTMEPGETVLAVSTTLSGCKAADPNAPPPRSNHTTSLHENSVVLFGGHGGSSDKLLVGWEEGDGYVKSIRNSYKDIIMYTSKLHCQLQHFLVLDRVFCNTWVSKMYLNRNLIGHQLKKSHGWISLLLSTRPSQVWATNVDLSTIPGYWTWIISPETQNKLGGWDRWI